MSEPNYLALLRDECLHARRFFSDAGMTAKDFYAFCRNEIAAQGSAEMFAGDLGNIAAAAWYGRREMPGRPWLNRAQDAFLREHGEGMVDLADALAAPSRAAFMDELANCGDPMAMAGYSLLGGKRRNDRQWAVDLEAAMSALSLRALEAFLHDEECPIPGDVRDALRSRLGRIDLFLSVQNVAGASDEVRRLSKITEEIRSCLEAEKSAGTPRP